MNSELANFFPEPLVYQPTVPAQPVAQNDVATFARTWILTHHPDLTTFFPGKTGLRFRSPPLDGEGERGHDLVLSTALSSSLSVSLCAF